LGLLLWNQESFAYADSYDDVAKRYRGLRCGKQLSLAPDNLDGLLVKPDIATAQQTAETVPTTNPASVGGTPGIVPGTTTNTNGPSTPDNSPRPLRRFHGTAQLDPMRTGRDAGEIANEVIAHLAGVVGAEVRVTLEIEAILPSGAPDHLVRTVTENSRTLKFTSQGFEEE
jgi:hypothetical protein